MKMMLLRHSIERKGEEHGSRTEERRDARAAKATGYNLYPVERVRRGGGRRKPETKYPFSQ
jgi:hypothetical protein